MARPDLNSTQILRHLGVIVAIAAAIGVLAAGLAVPFVGIAGAGTNTAAESLRKLPAELKAEPLAQQTRVLSRGGKQIALFYDENRVNVSLSNVAKPMREAIVAIEDYKFYEHGAVYLTGILRAALNNAASSGGSTQGGSTITQQMAKLTAVSQADSEAERKAATANTLDRKLQELRHAIAFEENYSKDWILERYLNIAYFGDGAYGIQSASRHYFSVDASKLNVRQAATLAGLVKNPVGFDPTRYPQRAKGRRDVVLNRMAQLNLITPTYAEQAKATPLGLKLSKSTNGCLGSKAPFFCEYVREYLRADPALGQTVEDREKLLGSGGLTIQTTVDLDFQVAAEQAAANRVNAKDNAIGAVAMVQPGTGQVLGIGQSRPMGRKKAKGETFLNYVVDSKYGDSNGFQGGSTFKLFVLAAALEQGIPVSTRISSPQNLSIPFSEFEDCGGAPYSGGGNWDLGNSTSAGSTENLYTGTAKSVNTFFANLEARTGLCEPFALARKMGVNLPYPTGNKKLSQPPQRVPSFVLGVTDVSPLEMAGAYATFAARGKYCKTRPVTQILNAEGKVFKNYPNECKRVLKEGTADQINDILSEVMQPGGFGQSLAIGKPSAGKTGTIQSNRAVWFVGYTPQIATAAMIAGANAQGTQITLNNQVVGGRYIGDAFGSTVAGPMWRDAMYAINDQLEYKSFESPPEAEPVYVPPKPKPTAKPDPKKPNAKPDRPRNRGNGGRGRGRGGDDTAVGATLQLGLQRTHHSPHRLHAVPTDAQLGDGLRDERAHLVLAELFGKVVGDDRRLGPLLLSLLTPTGITECLGRLAALLRLTDQHREHLLVAEHLGLFAGHLGVGHGGEHHP